MLDLPRGDLQATDEMIFAFTCVSLMLTSLCPDISVLPTPIAENTTPLAEAHAETGLSPRVVSHYHKNLLRLGQPIVEVDD